MVNEFVQEEARPNYIQFETRPKENKRASLEKGHYVAENVDYVMVTIPGNRDIFEAEVTGWFKKKELEVQSGRENAQFLDMYKQAYERWKKNEEIPLNGTAIKTWSAISPAQVQTVLHAGIRTVEDLANVNDDALRRLGMGGRDLINKAKSWLKSADQGKVSLENASLVKENEELKKTVASLEEKVNILMRKMEDEEAVNVNIGVGEEPFHVEQKDPQEYFRELKAEYREKFGRRAHPRTTIEKLEKKLGK